MSYDLRADSGSRSSSSSSRRSIGSSHGCTGGASSQLDGKNDRYRLIAAMHSASFANSPSPTPLVSQWIFDPPSSCSPTSCPVTAFTSGGPPSAIEPIPFTIGT